MAKIQQTTVQDCSRCEALEHELQARYEDLATLQKLLVNIDGSNNRGDSKMASNRKNLTQSDIQQIQYNQQLTHDKKQLTSQLMHERAARKVSEAKLAQMRNSSFWRITAPLRTALQWFRSI